MQNAIDVIRRNDRLRVPWKNGAGVTEEIASGTSWRASMADLGATPTHFSAFEGRSRIFTIVGDFGVDFDIDGETTRIDPIEPFRFDGAMTPHCRPAGPTSAFNIMVDDTTTTAFVTVHDIDDNTVRTQSESVTVIYVRWGAVTVFGFEAAAGDCVVLGNSAADITGSAQILIAAIRSRFDAPECP